MEHPYSLNPSIYERVVLTPEDGKIRLAVRRRNADEEVPADAAEVSLTPEQARQLANMLHSLANQRP